jgi:hypothetical protein
MMTMALISLSALHSASAHATSGTNDGAAEITTGSQSAVVDQTVTWMKKHVALTANQIESIVKSAAALHPRADTMSETALADELNKLLTESQISGIQILNRHDPMYWLYRERFGLTGPQVPPQLPAWLTRRGRNWHVWAAATPQQTAGSKTLTRGDEVIFPAGEPFAFATGSDGKTANAAAAQTLSVQIKSLAHEKAETRSVPLTLKSTGQLLTDIVRTNARRIPLNESGSRNVAYLPLPGTDLPALRETYTTLMDGFATAADALIVDLRGPYGEGGLSGVDLFLSEKGERLHFKKNLYVLVDRYTAGGREALAAMLQRHAGAVLIGETTAGISAPVEVADLDQGRFLLVATQDEKESFGPLKPDHQVPDTLAYVAGRDDVLTRALAVAKADLR